MNADTLRHLIEFINLKQFFADNSPLRLLLIAAIVFIMLGVARFICAILQKKLEKFVSSKTGQGPHANMDLMDVPMFEKVIRNTRRILYLVVIAWGLGRLVIGPLYTEVIHVVFTTLCIWAGIEFFTAFVPFNLDLYLRRQGTTLKTSQTRSLLPILKGLVWAIGLTFLLDNLGFHISTIIAGLGIVGVAVGLAGQAILADFFSYIVILLDKPFRIGDHVELSDGKAGDVEYMGPKTTHLRNLDDDLIICANAEMTKGVLVNQGSITERPVIMKIGVAYDTPIELLKKMPDLLRDVVDSFPHCSFDRACLVDFGSSNLIFQLIYLVSKQRGGIRDFMNTRSLVNIAILEMFNEQGITMAYPTENIIIDKLPPMPATQATQKPENTQAKQSA